MCGILTLRDLDFDLYFDLYYSSQRVAVRVDDSSTRFPDHMAIRS